MVLEDVAFDVQVGEAVALWGHNGAGKTTAIRCLLGLSRCAGSLLVLDAPLERGGKEARRRLGYVPQELALHDDMRTDETLAFYARLKRVGGERPAEVLAEVGMAATLVGPSQDRWAGAGIAMLTPAQGIQLLEQVIQSPSTQVAVLSVDWSSQCRSYQGEALPPILTRFIHTPPSGSTPSGQASSGQPPGSPAPTSVPPADWPPPA